MASNKTGSRSVTVPAPASVAAPSQDAAPSAPASESVTPPAPSQDAAPAPAPSVDESLEGIVASLSSVRWAHVIGAAKGLAPLLPSKDGEQIRAVDDKTARANARKLSAVAPGKTFAFRVALLGYANARLANESQKAELASILPALALRGSLTERAATFGGLALPPLRGEF